MRGRIGISVDGLVFQPLVSLSTLEDDEIELGVTLLEIGSSTTNIAVYHVGSSGFSSYSTGSASITNDIAVMLQVRGRS